MTQRKLVLIPNFWYQDYNDRKHLQQIYKEVLNIIGPKDKSEPLLNNCPSSANLHNVTTLFNEELPDRDDDADEGVP